MEELVLTDPIVVPEKVTDKYKVSMLILDWVIEVLPGVTGQVTVKVRDNNDVFSMFIYQGQEALDMMKWMNTANFSTNSMHKRILQKLSNDGYLPGTVTGSPDTPPPEL